jgi:hypothetical protein
MRWLFMVLLAGNLVGCAGATGSRGLRSSDPTERGLSYVAAAIVTGAVIRAICNK